MRTNGSLNISPTRSGVCDVHLWFDCLAEQRLNGSVRVQNYQDDEDNTNARVIDAADILRWDGEEAIVTDSEEDKILSKRQNYGILFTAYRSNDCGDLDEHHIRTGVYWPNNYLALGTRAYISLF